MIGCPCQCHNEPPEHIVMDACGCWGPECCAEMGKRRSELVEPRVGTQVARHTMVGGKGVVGRIKR